MDCSDAAASGSATAFPQPRKLYIKIMQKSNCLSTLETQFLAYFRDYGPVEDLKILRNSGLNRQV